MYRIDKSPEPHQVFTHGIQLSALQELLGDDEIELICHQLGHRWRNRIFTPAVTVRSMVYRALSPDKSIRATLADLAAAGDRIEQAPADASWCQARSRLPEELWTGLLQHSIRRLEQLASDQDLYHQRPVYLIDGSTLSMPDTPELAACFGYSGTGRGPSHFPVARVTLIIRAGLQGVWDYRVDAYRTSEDAHLHQMWDRIPGGSICIFDNQLSSFYNLAKLEQRGIDVVAPLHHHRDPYKLISRGKPLGPDEWIVWLELWPHRRKQYADPSLPRRLPIRLVRQEILLRNKPTLIWLVTTLLDAHRHPRENIADLYRKRWGIETRIGELKTTLRMNVLRGKGVRAVRYEVAASILAYNLLRTLIRHAARQNQAPPDRISFAAAIKTILAYSLPLRLSGPAQRPRIYARMLRDIARCRVPIRPGRVEPRRIKRIGSPYPRLTIARRLARQKCLS